MYCVSDWLLLISSLRNRDRNRNNAQKLGAVDETKTLNKNKNARLGPDTFKCVLPGKFKVPCNFKVKKIDQ